jgi:hypothetical protein
MALTNLGFEDDDGGTPGVGVPDAWTINITTAAEQVAAWGAETPPLDEDGFEIEWNNDDYLFAFEDADTLPGLYDEDVGDGEAIEDFEEGWDGNEGYLFEDGSSEQAAFDAALTPEDNEDFEDGWDSAVTAGNDYDLVLGASTLASFDDSIASQGFEDFEDGWNGTGADNDYDLTLGSSTAAVFDGAGADAIEDFEETFQEVQVSVAPGTDLFTAVAPHNLSAGDRVTFRHDGVGGLPAGLNPSYVYFVIASGLTGTAFRVSLASGGTTIDVTDAGSGEFFVRGDPDLFWILDA